jgi:hypothetical protein
MMKMILFLRLQTTSVTWPVTIKMMGFECCHFCASLELAMRPVCLLSQTLSAFPWPFAPRSESLRPPGEQVIKWFSSDESELKRYNDA